LLKCCHDPWCTAAALFAKLKQFAIIREVPPGGWINDYGSGLAIQAFITVTSNSCNAAIETWIVCHCRTNTNQNTIVA
jgi:hypothetical protein